MRYVVYGSGAVGGVIGARLHLAGTPTTLIARGAHRDAIEAHGLVLDTAGGRLVARAPVADTVAGLSWSDDTVVLLCVKSHQTAAALADLTAYCPPGTPVVCVQNGIANETAVLRRFAHTYAVTVMLPSLHREPGVVVEKCHPTPGILDVGRVPTGIDPTAEAVAADLRAAGFESVPRPDIMAWKRRKLLVNIGGDVTALFGRDATATDLAARVVAEAEAAVAASGAEVVTGAQDDERRGDVLRLRPDAADYAGNSLRQSLDRGLDSEVDYRVGEAVLLGRLHGVRTPAGEAFQRAVHDLVRRGARPEPGSAARLLESLAGNDEGPVTSR